MPEIKEKIFVSEDLDSFKQSSQEPEPLIKQEKVEEVEKVRTKILLPDFKSFVKKIIKVRRFDASSMMSQYRDVYIDAKTQIATFIDSSTGNTLRPLSREEEFILMPEILNIRADAPEFNSKLDDYFASIGADIPDEGLDLDITIENEVDAVKHNGEVIKIEYPVNIPDYVIYRLIKKHIEKGFRVASSLKEAIIGVHEFYIEDIQKDNEDKNKVYNDIQKARLNFMNLTLGEKSLANKEKIEMLFDITFTIHQKYSHNTSLDDMIRILDEEVLQKNPDKMVSLMADKYLADKALINKLLIYNILSIQGNIYFNDSEPMGDLEDAIKYLNNPNRSGIKEKLRAKLEQSLRKVK